ncbi:MAG: OmpA family protein [Chitinivibrionales bacterium]
MTSRSSKMTVVAVFAAITVFVGCNPKTTKIEPEPEPVVEADTSFTEPEPLADIDTSDDVSFNQADLDAQREKEVRENLKTVYFEYNSFSLSPAMTDQLGIAAKYMMNNRSMRVLLEGHCDERGSAEYNMGLGENRARAVKDFLLNYGVPSVQVEITSWGKERVAEVGCGDEACHLKNRRVEFKVLAQ